MEGTISVAFYWKAEAHRLICLAFRIASKDSKPGVLTWKTYADPSPFHLVARLSDNV